MDALTYSRPLHGRGAAPRARSSSRRGPARVAALRARPAAGAGCDREPECGPLQRAQAAFDAALRGAGVLAAAASLLLTGPPALPAAAAAPGAEEEQVPGGVLLRLPASEDPDIYQTQQTLLEAWGIVGDSFVDGKFNGHNWPDELRAHMVAAYAAHDGRAAFHEIEQMLSDLGDPYTRIIPSSEYADFRVSSDGELQGVGLLIANEPVHNHLLVLSAIKGGPADRAGITSGDEVISINDQPTEGWTGDMAARLLRGKGGTEVRVKFARRTSGIPGVPGRPEPPLSPPDAETVREVRLRRERVALTPLYYTALQAPGLTLPGASLASAPPPGGGGARLAAAPPLAQGPISPPPQPAGLGLAAAAGDTRPERLGYLRLQSFSQNAAEDMARAIRELEASGVSGYILDLRDNPGGLVRAGMDIASQLLDGHPTLFSITGREGEPLQHVTLGGGDLPDGEAPAAPPPAGPLTRRPLAVLVNERSASASEILSGALHDNRRAVIVGDSRTFGKGRIQSVYELHDGSALFVTVAKYLTPSGAAIDMRGIQPDLPCGAGPAAPLLGGGGGGEEQEDAAMLAAGLPLGPRGEAAMASALARDRCVLTAANVLRDKAAVVRATSQVASKLPRAHL